MKIGKLQIITTTHLNKLIEKEKAKAISDFISNDFPKMHDEIWNEAIENFCKTPVGKKVVERKELEEENERLKLVEEEYNQLCWAKHILNKFNKVV